MLGKVDLAVLLIWGSKVFSLEAVSQAWRPQRNQRNHGARGKPWPPLDQAGSAYALEQECPRASPLQTNANLLFPFLLSLFLFFLNLKHALHVIHAHCGKCRI